MKKHPFTTKILEVLEQNFPGRSVEVLAASDLLNYINTKTRSANDGSKARGSFANLYALYALVEDYIGKGYATVNAGAYKAYEGARFGDLFRRQRELPFGAKLQNHGLNSRLNEEFKKYFPNSVALPIVRDVTSQHYWVNESLLELQLPSDGTVVNLAAVVIGAIDAYIAAKKAAFEKFIELVRELHGLEREGEPRVVEFIRAQLEPSVDARVFEIVSFAILKAYFGDQIIYWGWNVNELNEEPLRLYKTGRTNANDGGIDFVMRPLGRFFQVTETTDVDKYFLDIEKVQRFPITFVIKTKIAADEVLAEIRKQAETRFSANVVVDRLLEAIEEIINIPFLMDKLNRLIDQRRHGEVLSEILQQSRLEFNADEDLQEAVATDMDETVE